MGKVLLVLTFLVGLTFALDWGSGYGKRPYKDYWGNSYKNYDNMWKDSDGDGVLNYYDYNDRDPNVQTPYDRPLIRSNRGLWGW